MARRTAGGCKKDDAAWVESTFKKLIMDASFSSLAELEDWVGVDAGELPDLNMELPEFDVDLSSFAGETCRPASGPASSKAPLPLASGTQVITIRVHARVLLAYKAQAGKTGIPYQTLMKRDLASAAEGFL